MRAIDITTTPRSFGMTRGQYPGMREGVLLYRTEGDLDHAWDSDFRDVMGPVEDWKTHGHTSQGGRLIAITEDQLAALQQIDEARRVAKEERAAAERGIDDGVDGDINKLLRKHGNAAATEGY